MSGRQCSLPLVATLCFAALLPASANAQGIRTLAPGTRVRLPAAAGVMRRELGQVVSSTNDSAVVEVQVPRSAQLGTPAFTERRVVALASLEVPNGVVGHAGDGALIGLASGALGGGVLGYIGGDDCTRNEFICFDRRDTGIAGAALGGAVGLIVGAFVGANHHTDHWTRVGSASAAFRVSGQGTAIAVRLPF